MGLDHQRLIEEAISGKPKARQELYERHEQYWFRICLRYCRNRSEAQDVFQEGVLKLFNVLSKYRVGSNSFQSWSNKIIVNEALKFMKKHHWKQSFEDLETVEDIPNMNENALEALNSKEIIQMIQKLPSGYRMVFNMFELEGFSHKEIAKALDISIGTSKSQLSKAKKLLRKQLEVHFKS